MRSIALDINIKIIFSFLASFLITFLVLPRLSHLASKIGLLDQPGKRKIHKTPKPLVGGIGMMIGVAITMLLFVPLEGFRGVYAGMILLTLVGFFDDFREIPHQWKFIAQIVAALLMVYFSGVILHYFGNLLSFGHIKFNRSALLLTIFSTVGVINAINMIDGLDGLSGGVALTAFSSFAILSFLNSQTALLLLSIAFCGSLIAFLRYNWHPSSLFMGDAGSLTIGFALTFLSMALTQTKTSIVPPVAPLLVLAVPITDTLTVMTKRAIKGKNPFMPDRNHLHHILIRFGLEKTRVSKIIIFMSACFALVGIAGTIFRVPEYFLFAFFLIYFISYFTASFYIKEIFIYVKKQKNGRAISAAKVQSS